MRMGMGPRMSAKRLIDRKIPEYYTDFSEYEADSPPSDWTKVFHNDGGFTENRVRDDEPQQDTIPSTGGKVWHINAGISNDDFGYHPQGYKEVGDCEIHVRFENNTTSDLIGLMFKGFQGSSGEINMYGATLYSNDLRAHFWQNDVRTVEASQATGSFNIASQDWLEMKAQIIGRNLKMKAWHPEFDGEEPEWIFEHTFTGDLGVNKGLTGIFYGDEDNIIWDFIRITPL